MRGIKRRFLGALTQTLTDKIIMPPPKKFFLSAAALAAPQDHKTLFRSIDRVFHFRAIALVDHQTFNP
jgi:hypothetical protein